MFGKSRLLTMFVRGGSKDSVKEEGKEKVRGDVGVGVGEVERCFCGDWLNELGNRRQGAEVERN
jgi:hypothetical protein